MNEKFRPVEIRPVTVADVDAVADLARLIWNRHYPAIITQAQIDYMLAQRYGRQRLLEELAEPQIWWDQAFIDGVRVGFDSVHVSDRIGEVKLDKIYVHPDVQRQGVGAALIGHVADRARQDGFRTLALAVNKRNLSAIAAYQKHGFVVRESVRVDIGEGFVMDDYIMVKTL